MRLSLLSEDNDVAELLINKAMELMCQAETAAAEGDGEAVGERDDGLDGLNGGHH
jgi:hypothetical protein